LKTECEEDSLVKKGFTFAETTFDSLFVKGWQLQGDESSEEELAFAQNQNPSSDEANQKSAFEVEKT
jgi:hypothetical protein